MANDIEIRHLTTDVRVVRGSGSAPALAGYAIVFNSLSEDLGGFKEVIKPQAVDRTLRENIDVRALVDHDAAKILGRITASTLRIKSDAHGLAIEIDPPNTSYGRDIVESVRRGDVSGMSFAFRVMPDGTNWLFDEEPPIRQVLDMRVREVSVVTWPAYTATDVEVAQRSLRQMKKGSPLQMLANKLRQARA